MNFERENYYNIADLSLVVRGGVSVDVLAQNEGFIPFAADSSAHGADIEVITDCELQKSDFADVEHLYTFNAEQTDHIFSVSGSTFIFELRYDNHYTMLSYEQGSKSVRIAKCDNSAMLKFAVWAGFSLAAIEFGAIPIHASTVVKDGGGMLFLGESGRGKSTHSRMWIESIPGAYLLNDDSPILRAVDGVLMVYGSPWSGKTSCYKAEMHPVKALVRIERGQTNQINRLPAIKAIGAIYPSLPTMFAYSKPLAAKMLSLSSQIIGLSAVYELYCLPNGDAAQVNYREVYGA